jgi:uncharacterized damage-inducible protein DinB
MTLLDRLLGHDAWTTRELLRRCRSLTDEQLDRPFEIGHRSVRATVEHVVFNMEVWGELMAGERPMLNRDARARSIDGLLTRVDRAAERLRRVTTAVASRDGWDERWLDVLDHPPAHKTYGGALAHVITHSMHHRAQLLFMLRQLGLGNLPEGDVLTWERIATAAETS